MTIRKGSEWGSVGSAPPDAPVARSDRDAARLVAAHLTGSRPPEGEPPVVVLLAGDMHRCVGAPADVTERWKAGHSRLLPVDLLAVEWDGGRDMALAHVVARHLLWRGDFVVAMNATHVGPLDLGPRAHPGDGLVDLTVGRLGGRDRLVARRRARLGGHLPHPALNTPRTSRWEGDLGRQTPLRIDGEVVGRTRRLRVEVIPDALVIAV